MLDDLNDRPSGDAQRDAQPRLPGQGAPMADREVPIVASTPFEAMHRWLDGEGSEAAAQRDGESARYVSLWRTVGQETARGRTRSLSPDFADRVMAAIATEEAPAARAELRVVAATATAAAAGIEAPRAAAPQVAPVAHAAPATAGWLQRPLEINGAMALTMGAGLVAVGALLGLALGGR